MKFRARGPKSEAGPLLLNKYMFYYETEKVGHPTLLFSNILPLKNMSCQGPKPTGAHGPLLRGLWQ